MAGIDQYTKLLLHMDDGNFTDSTNKIVTNNGTTLDTAIKKFGNGSAKFNGSSNLSIAHSSDFEFGNGNFTVDMWIYVTTLPTGYISIYDKRASAGNYGNICITLNSSNVVLFSTSNGTSWDIANGVIIASGITINQWNHVTVCRNGNSIYGFVNGVKGSNVITTSLSILQNTNNVLIGGLATAYMNGYIDEVRVSKGIARWTSDFTPPTSQYSLDKYLIKQNNQYYTIKSEFYPIGQDPLTKEMVDKYGSDSLTNFTNTFSTNSALMTNGGVLGTGQQFSVDLNGEMLSLNDVSIE